jgi:hypothetical protein
MAWEYICYKNSGLRDGPSANEAVHTLGGKNSCGRKIEYAI